MPTYNFTKRGKPVVTELVQESEFVDTPCEILMSHKNEKNGRPMLMHPEKKKDDMAARVMWHQLKGPIPEGMHCLHKCHNKKCINVDHLYIGTNDDNIRDNIEAKKVVGRKGSEHWGAKLDEVKVKEIKKLLQQNIPQIHIAKMFDISRYQIWRIKHNKGWTHVD
jgi:hypothetical protein